MLTTTARADAEAAASLSPGLVLLPNAIGAYEGAFDRYPESWHAVRACGLVQRDLITVDGKLINPDDGKLDFVGDFTYKFNGAEEEPELLTLSSRNGIESVQEVPCGYSSGTFAETVADFEAHGISIAPYRKTDACRLGRAMVNLMDLAITTYSSVGEGEVNINSFEELLALPYCPYDVNSVNPLTGLPLRADGAPQSFVLVTSDKTVDTPVIRNWPVPPMIFLVGPDGKQVNGGF